MGERKKEQDDTQIRRDTNVRGSLGVPPGGSADEESRRHEEITGTAERDRMRAHVADEDDDRMSER